jgi:hypothetical protein
MLLGPLRKLRIGVLSSRSSSKSRQSLEGRHAVVADINPDTSKLLFGRNDEVIAEVDPRARLRDRNHVVKNVLERLSRHQIRNETGDAALGGRCTDEPFNPTGPGIRMPASRDLTGGTGLARIQFRNRRGRAADKGDMAEDHRTGAARACWVIPAIFWRTAKTCLGTRSENRFGCCVSHSECCDAAALTGWPLADTSSRNAAMAAVTASGCSTVAL